MNRARLDEVFADGERLDDLLLGDYKILQSKNYYNFTSDSVRLANFANVKNGGRVLELCAGCGIVSLHKFADNAVTRGDAGRGQWVCVELQKPLYDLLRKNIYINELDDTFTAINDDLKNTFNYVPKASFDVVLCNPPYEKADTGFKKMSQSDRLARAEVATNFDEIARVAGGALRFGGAFYFLAKSERLFEIAIVLNKYNMRIKSVEFITKNARFRLALVKAVVGAKHGCTYSLHA